MLDGIHHVISIGSWLQEMTVASARERVFVSLVNKRGSFFHLGLIAGGGTGGPWEVTFATSLRVERRIRRASPERRGLCVWMSAFSPVWRAHKQEAMIPSGVSAGAGFHKVVIWTHKGVSNIRQSPCPPN